MYSGVNISTEACGQQFIKWTTHKKIILISNAIYFYPSFDLKKSIIFYQPISNPFYTTNTKPYITKQLTGKHLFPFLLKYSHCKIKTKQNKYKLFFIESFMKKKTFS